MYTVIEANKDQVDTLYNKHVKPWLGIEKIISSSFSYDDEDDIGFVTLRTITGKKIEYQMRGDRPCFVSFSGFGNIRYDISYPDQLNQDLYNILKEKGQRASANFWKGGEI